MPRPPKSPPLPFAAPQLLSWAEMIGEALGRGVARGINAGLSGVAGAPRRGRPPKGASAEKLCSVAGCGREARSKGLCSAHYQAERRRALQKSGKA